MHDLIPSDAIVDLLAGADEQERRLHSTSTASEFEAVMQEIIAEVDVEPPVARDASGAPSAAVLPLEFEALVMPPVPAPDRKPDPFELPSRPAPKLATNPGDLVFVFGLREDALTVAHALAVATPTIEVAVAGTIGRPGSRHVGDRREALQARADGVRRGSSTLVAIGAGQAPSDATRYADILHDVVPDQVWIAVDVTRKPEDTRVWAQLVAEAGGGVDAIAAIGMAYTTTPDSTAYLGIPVGWADGR